MNIDFRHHKRIKNVYFDDNNYKTTIIILPIEPILYARCYPRFFPWIRLQLLYEADTINIPTLQMKKLNE